MNVNGRPVSVPRTSAPLLQVLRNDLRLNGPKYGCGMGQCGACTVHVDGVATRSCVVPTSGVAGRLITTLEGLGSRDAWHPVQAAFEDAQAAQCGYCLNGMVMQAVALLLRESAPTPQLVKAELSGNLCRCGTHVEILKAVELAVIRMASLQTVSEE
ncbi:(2Fe-2S)-binding protein [Variovorax saccharolyticus]|uniref:(2Fe-2S)-binding protein n=1 Tax=Variovorax saccharolyticus TaxID=3053516 RepID=UPI004037EFDE